MKKFTFSFLLCLLFSVLTVHAQQAEKFDPVKDKEAIRGYVIHLLPVPGNTFGFMIVKDKTTVWSQLSNPFSPDRQKGFAHKSDAYKLAEWVVSEQEKNSHAPIIFKPEMAKQLNLSETTLH